MKQKSGADPKAVLGKKIKHLRKMCDLTQMDLAKALGLTSTGAISQVENGTRALKTENILKAAEVFGVSPAVLMAPDDYSREDLEMFKNLQKIIKQKDKSPYYEAVRRLLKNDSD